VPSRHATIITSCCTAQIGSLYLNGNDALAPGKDPATSSNFAATTLHACRQQLAEDGADADAWLGQQVAARAGVEVTYSLQMGPPWSIFCQGPT
jgi:hypothetical protein